MSGHQLTPSSLLLLLSVTDSGLYVWRLPALSHQPDHAQTIPWIVSSEKMVTQTISTFDCIH